jgi:hypothetical protein
MRNEQNLSENRFSLGVVSKIVVGTHSLTEGRRQREETDAEEERRGTPSVELAPEERVGRRRVKGGDGK